MDSHVKLYDPSAPGFCRLELAANFNPLRHTRWEFRPSALTVQFHRLKLDGVTEAHDAALHVAGIHTAEDVAAGGAAGLVKVPGVKAALAAKLLTWADQLIPPKVEDEDAGEEQDPALAALVDHQEHEARQAGEIPEDDGEEPAVGPAAAVPSGPAGDSAQGAAAQPGDSAPVSPAAPATTAPETPGSAPSA